MFSFNTDYSKNFLISALFISSAFIWIIKATGCIKKVQCKGKEIFQLAPHEKSSRLLLVRIDRTSFDDPTIVTLVTRRLFYEITGDLGEGLNGFTFQIQEQSESKLYAENSSPLTITVHIKGKQFTTLLSVLFDKIDWKNLEKRWQGLTNRQWKKLKNCFFDRFLHEDHNKYNHFFNAGNHPFLPAYCSSLYRAINPLLIKNQIALKKINIKCPKLGIDLFAKSILFSALCLAGSVQQLPSIPSGTLVKRHVTLKGSAQERYQIGTIVTEPYFASTSQGKYICKVGEGNTLFHIITSTHSCGKDIKKFSRYAAENEVLFPPFTQFEVVDRRIGKAKVYITYNETEEIEQQHVFMREV